MTNITTLADNELQCNARLTCLPHKPDSKQRLTESGIYLLFDWIHAIIRQSSHIIISIALYFCGILSIQLMYCEIRSRMSHHLCSHYNHIYWLYFCHYCIDRIGVLTPSHYYFIICDKKCLSRMTYIGNEVISKIGFRTAFRTGIHMQYIWIQLFCFVWLWSLKQKSLKSFMNLTNNSQLFSQQ